MFCLGFTSDVKPGSLLILVMFLIFPLAYLLLFVFIIIPVEYIYYAVAAIPFLQTALGKNLIKLILHFFLEDATAKDEIQVG